MKTAIVTDTNSGIMVEEGRAKGIYVIAMPVLIDGECYFEGVDITSGQFYDALKNGRNVLSSQPSPGDVMELWNALFKKDDIMSRFSEIDAGRIRIGTAGTFEKEEDAGWWLELVQETFPEVEVYYRPLYCSIASHVGIDAAGIGVCAVNR